MARNYAVLAQNTYPCRRREVMNFICQTLCGCHPVISAEFREGPSPSRPNGGAGLAAVGPDAAVCWADCTTAMNSFWRVPLPPRPTAESNTGRSRTPAPPAVRRRPPPHTIKPSPAGHAPLAPFSGRAMTRVHGHGAPSAAAAAARSPVGAP